MIASYKPSSYKIGQYYCVAIDPNDRMVSGTNGWIFEAGHDRIGVVVLEKDKTARRGRNSGYAQTEKLTYCNIKEIKDHVSAIGVLRDLVQAAHYANNPNARHGGILEVVPA